MVHMSGINICPGIF